MQSKEQSATAKRVKEHYDRMVKQGYKQTKIWLKPEQVKPMKEIAAGNSFGDPELLERNAELNILVKELEDSRNKLVIQLAEQEIQLAASKAGVSATNTQDLPEIHPKALDDVIQYINDSNERIEILSK